MREEPFAEWRAVRSWACAHYEITQGELELIFSLHKKEHFTTEDFINGTLLLNWNKHRWKNMLDRGLIELYRSKQGGANHRYNIYKLSRKAKSMVRKCMAIIAGEEPIPTKIFEKKKYKYKLIRKYINELYGR